ncbi:nuclear transport factor 2 family protein [Devosia sp.]|uniref:nuclear transport factor 2 family protein n=1 Tax=Devosia sp. TaxID=1871048 RepID=UPI003A905D64
MSNADIACAVFKAFEAGDRAALERLLATGFRFVSPYDNGIDRESYFALCWPAHEMIARFDLRRVVAQDDTVVVTYDGTFHDGRRNRNTEIFTVRDGLVQVIEVYFGWTLPHPVAPGQHQSP